MDDFVYDPDRKVKAPSRELYFYPYWDELDKVRKIMRSEKNRIWKNGSAGVVLMMKIKEYKLIHCGLMLMKVIIQQKI